MPVEGAEIKPGKHFDTRIKPLPLTNGHGRYMAVTPERTLVSVGVGEWPLHIYIYIYYETAVRRINRGDL